MNAAEIANTLDLDALAETYVDAVLAEELETSKAVATYMADLIIQCIGEHPACPDDFTFSRAKAIALVKGWSGFAALVGRCG